MLLSFAKMHGAGNDFMVIDAVTQHVRIKPDRVRRLADRHTGVGFDQLLLIEPPGQPDRDFAYRIYNPDGSEAEQCGNGLRCIALFLYERKLIHRRTMCLHTNWGLFDLCLHDDGSSTVDMGAPRLQPADVPFVAERESVTHSLEVEGQQLSLAVLSMGNPHAVLVTADSRTAQVERQGAIISGHDRFPQGCNVGFMQVVSPAEINLRVYERGAGETQACGSGACAAVVAGRLQGLLAAQVKVNMPGGTLQVGWSERDQPVMLTGPACLVYEGKIKI